MKKSHLPAPLTHLVENSPLESQEQTSPTESQSGLHITEREPNQQIQNSNSSQVSAQQSGPAENTGSVPKRAEKRKHEDSERESSYRHRKQIAGGSQELSNPNVGNRKSGLQNHGGRGEADAKVPQLQRSVASTSKNPFVFSSHVVVPDTRKAKKSGHPVVHSLSQSEAKSQVKSPARPSTSHQSSNHINNLRNSADIRTSVNSARYQRELVERLAQRATGNNAQSNSRTRVERPLPSRTSIQDGTGVHPQHDFVVNQHQRERESRSSPRNIRGQLSRTPSAEHVRNLTASETVRSAYSRRRALLASHENSPMLSHQPAAGCSSTLLQLPSDGLFPLYPLGQPDDASFRSSLELPSTISFSQEDLYNFSPFQSPADCTSSQEMYSVSTSPKGKLSQSCGEALSGNAVPPSSVGIKTAGPYLLGTVASLFMRTVYVKS